MNSRLDLIGLGELLIDFTDNGISEQGNTIFEANPGGSVGNFVAMAARCGLNTGFVGRVGDDILGNKLISTLDELGIYSKGVIKDDTTATTMAFVKKLANGDRDFSFFRKPGADMMLNIKDIDEVFFASTRAVHISSFPLSTDTSYEATSKALDIAKKSGAIISFDPNIREMIWKDMNEAREKIELGFINADVLKISDNEIRWFTGIDDYDEAVGILMNKYNTPLILLSMGASGSRAYYRDTRVEVPAYIQDSIVDSTGAGDTFGGCCISFVLKYGLDNLNKEILINMLSMGNAAASLITQRKGALRVMPKYEDVEALIKNRNRE